MSEGFRNKQLEGTRILHSRASSGLIIQMPLQLEFWATTPIPTSSGPLSVAMYQFIEDLEVGAHEQSHRGPDGGRSLGPEITDRRRYEPQHLSASINKNPSG